MSNGKPRSEAWYEGNISDESRMRLVVNELDRLDARVEQVEHMIASRLNWIVVLFTTTALALIGNLILTIIRS